MDRDSNYFTLGLKTKKNLRMEGDLCPGEIDGPHLGSDLHRNVSKWGEGLFATRLEISYVGTRFLGWQKTKEGPSIQQVLEKALSRLYHQPVSCEAASRTDKGVHAEGQIVQFFSQKLFPIPDLTRALNGNLPNDIRVKEASLVPTTSHPTLDAKGKIYHYYLSLGPIQSAFQRFTSWHYPYEINFSLLEKTKDWLLSTKDFSLFTTEPTTNPICQLAEINWEQLPENQIKIIFKGDRFLYKMIRRLTGTLAQAASKKILLHKVGMTAPPHGLFLHKILY
jgi:tRNA pseudouridine38-40 synthase